MHSIYSLTIQAVTKSPIHVPTAAIFIKLSFLMPMYSVTMWGLQVETTKSEEDIKNKRQRILWRVVKAGREVRQEGHKEPTEGGSVLGEREKWSVMLSIIMLAVRVSQYQSNPVRTMSGRSTFHEAQRVVNNLHQCNRFHVADCFHLVAYCLADYLFVRQICPRV